MAATDKHDDTSAGLTGSSEESTLAEEMFKSVLTELKDLKQTVPLVETVYKDQWDDNVEQGDEESTAAGVDYVALCTSTSILPTTEYLFEDLPKLRKYISDANKLATTSASAQQEIQLEFPVQPGASRQSAIPAIPAAKE